MQFIFEFGCKWLKMLHFSFNILYFHFFCFRFNFFPFFSNFLKILNNQSFIDLLEREDIHKQSKEALRERLLFQWQTQGQALHDKG